MRHVVYCEADSNVVKEAREPSTIWQLCAQDLAGAFDEIIDDVDLLSRCYCGQRARQFDDLFLPAVLTDVAPSLVLNLREVDDAQTFFASRVEGIQPHSPWIIVGPPGCGKTTFLHYCFKVQCVEMGITDKIEPLFLDLKAENDETKIPNMIFDRAIAKMVRRHPELNMRDPELTRSIFEEDLRPYQGLIESSWWQSPEQASAQLMRIVTEMFIRDKRLMAKRYYEYSRSNEGKILCLVLDNMDMKPQSFQAAAFQAAAMAMRYLEIPAVVAMRNYTYPASYSHMELSQWVPRHLSLRAPNASELLSRRFDYVIRRIIPEHWGNIEEKHWTFIRERGHAIGSIADLQGMMEGVSAAFTSQSCSKHIDLISGANGRLLLSLCRRALQSHYLSSRSDEASDEAIAIRSSLYFKLHPSDITRALLLGNNRYMDPNDQFTFLINLYDNSEANSTVSLRKAALLGYRLLQVLDYHNDMGISVDVLRMNLTNMGYPQEWIDRRLNEYFRRGLCYERGSYFSPENATAVPNTAIINISDSGRYLIASVALDLTYIEHVKWVTALPEYLVRGISESQKSVLARMKSNIMFVAYLEQQERQDIAIAKEHEDTNMPFIKYLVEENAMMTPPLCNRLRANIISGARKILTQPGQHEELERFAVTFELGKI